MKAEKPLRNMILESMTIKVCCVNCLHERELKIGGSADNGFKIENDACPKCGSRMVEILEQEVKP